MCRICRGDPPTASSFNRFRTLVLEARRNVHDSSQFVANAIEADKARFATGDEWGEPIISRDVMQHIFNNAVPEQGLLVFTLSCWLDMQARYTTVWTTYLRQANNWIKGDGKMPRGSYPHTSPHLDLSMQTVRSCGSIGEWFIQTINGIVQKYGQSSGNLFRFAGHICSDLYNLRQSRLIYALKRGQLPTSFSGGDHKRFWMFMMFLRRDNSIIRCLFTRALNHHPNGQQAIQSWYDPTYFDPKECELPVDSRVFTNWNNLLKEVGLQNLHPRNPRQVAQQARLMAQRNDISPSVFDAILFF